MSQPLGWATAFAGLNLCRGCGGCSFIPWEAGGRKAASDGYRLVGSFGGTQAGWQVKADAGAVDAAALSYGLMSLPMAGAVLQVGAHPDDEDSGLLAYLAHGLCVRTVYWSATRGESGQNRLNAYRDEGLGVFRSWESEDARAIDGAEALFGPFYDFGYSKSGSETLAKWGRVAVIREIVRAIRLVQPEIVISRWTGQPADEHGHHQAIGELAAEAFQAAGDPELFPELGELGLVAWEPRRLYQSVGGDWTPEQDLGALGERREDLEREGVARIDAGQLDPIAGRTFQEEGWAALNEHRSQGMAMLPGAGRFAYYYRLLVDRDGEGGDGVAPEGGLFGGLDPSLTGLADHAGAGSVWLRERLQLTKSHAERAIGAVRIPDTTAAGRHLLEAISTLRATIVELGSHIDAEPRAALSQYLSRKLDDLGGVAAACFGLRLECRSAAVHVIPGQSFEVRARLWSFGAPPTEIEALRLRVPPDCHAEVAGGDQGRGEESGGAAGETSFKAIASREAALSCPYWLTQPREPYAYRWPPEPYCSLPFRPPRFEAECEVQVAGERLVMRAPAVARSAFPGGVRDLYPAVIPPVSLRPSPRVVSMPAGAEERAKGRPLPEPFEPGSVGAEMAIQLDVLARNHTDHPLTGKLALEAPSWMAVERRKVDVSLDADGSRPYAFKLTARSPRPAGTVALRFRIDCEGRSYSTGLTPVRMGPPNLAGEPDAGSCIRETFMLTPAQVDLHVIAARFARGLRYAYIAGAEEDVARLLAPFGVEFHIVDDEDLQSLDLSRFDAVVVGPGAYSARPELRKAAPRLIHYVEGGGTLIVQYQTYGYQAPGLAPYPFSYSEPHDRVTDEAAPVRLLSPEHSLFHVPNEVVEDDFDGWVDERGRYFFAKWDRRYRPLLASADPGEEPRLGGLVVAEHGRGTYVYCGYSLFRQLPAGAEGAYRLFANLLAIPAVRLAERMEFMRATEIFASLPDPQLAALAKVTSERALDDGTVISSQGELASEVYLVREGEVVITRRHDGADEEVGVCGKGSCIGEVAALGKLPRTASLVARGPTRLLALEEEELERLLQAQPEMSRALLTLLARRLAAEAGVLR
jgi:LmbE family N-acetylglucosaminyl deacetylase